ncbi:hypothetical protein MtrunA17_Chr2g0305951 [Medicago truncatula]|uniref:Transmembrane protein n=1 Tax=Medicago truncatula TaxID=3880 RepID=A0A396J7B2_MEDTR|nr:hypothetical protein MtrunA17_Chr2g0305951 [Medicago truncatula]
MSLNLQRSWLPLLIFTLMMLLALPIELILLYIRCCYILEAFCCRIPYPEGM